MMRKSAGIFLLIVSAVLPNSMSAQVNTRQTFDAVCGQSDPLCEEGVGEQAPVVCSEEMSDEECTSLQQGQVLAAKTEPFEAVAGDDRVVLVGAPVDFLAEKSLVPSYVTKEEVSYWWDFGDLAQQQGRSVTHTYQKPGDYVAVLTIKTPQDTATDTVSIKVADKALFLIVSRTFDALALNNILNTARQNGFLVHQISLDEGGNEFIVENNLLTAFLEQSDAMKRSRLIIGLTTNSVEVNVLPRLGKQIENSEKIFADKRIVIASQSIKLTSLRAQPLYDVLGSPVLVVSPDLIETVIAAEARDRLIRDVQLQGKDFVLLGIHSRRTFGTVRLYNFLSHFMNMLINKGVPVNTILLILMLPLVATMITFARHVIGFKALGIYIPTILTLTFVSIGLNAGLLIMLVILIVGTGMRVFLQRLRLLYLPRMALLITMVSIAMLVLFYITVYFPHFSLVSLSAFPVLILIILVEDFIKVQIEYGARNAAIVTVETLMLSLISYYIVNLPSVRNLILSYPEIILATIVINIILGKWTGLRLWEQYRFRELLAAMRRAEKKRG